jgi:acyl-coenzyme A synthetase/AMP-(fatty) acid ligase
MNFAEAVMRGADPAATALISIAADGAEIPHSFAALDDASARLATRLRALGAGPRAVVMTVMGNSPEWVQTLLAAFRLGAVALPCVTQSRPGDLALRARATAPAVVVTTEAYAELVRAAALDCPVLVLPDPTLAAEEPAGHADVAADDPALLIFTSGTSGEPKAVVHGSRYLFGQDLQARHWLGVRAGDRMWCTAAAGWSKSARNSFIAPWLLGATAVVHDARFDPDERLALIDRLGVDVLCMSPTEYRMILRRAAPGALPGLRAAVAAGEALGADTAGAWQDATGVPLRDGYGQTETGAVTANPADRPPVLGSMGLPLPGLRTTIERGELVLDPASSPTFFLHYADGSVPQGPWRTGDLVERDEQGHLWFRGRADDMIVSAGYRIGPTEVEDALARHPAVIEAGVVPAPDAERGHVVRAVIVLADGYAPSEALVRDLQAHVRRETAPFKYPRIVDFTSELPRTPSGKLQRARLRDGLRSGLPPL